ncbi:hypothetical protein SCOCK_300012 [Actinacidiphila cocklensis]|uniref:Uncharacterized protein n=1 Tax=Actinacidiphila cocklensis TaxID=887465 RepID=A0A9W4DXA2_9ACTN|nr:hypothetical protein SCOCK_300012 [Actinacidiphila cocklensis]
MAGALEVPGIASVLVAALGPGWAVRGGSWASDAGKAAREPLRRAARMLAKRTRCPFSCHRSGGPVAVAARQGRMDPRHFALLDEVRRSLVGAENSIRAVQQAFQRPVPVAEDRVVLNALIPCLTLH